METIFKQTGPLLNCGTVPIGNCVTDILQSNSENLNMSRMFVVLWSIMSETFNHRNHRKRTSFHRSRNKLVLFQMGLKANPLFWLYKKLNNCCYWHKTLVKRVRDIFGVKKTIFTNQCNLLGQHDWLPLNHLNNPNQCFRYFISLFL